MDPFARIEERIRFTPEKYQKVGVFETDRLAMDCYCLLPGQAQKAHSHDANDKVYLVWSGRVSVRIGGEARALGPGEAAIAEPGVEHGVENQGSEPAVVVVFQAPKPW